MSGYEWSDVTLEGAGCFLLLVLAYKLYRMRVSTSSNCCDGGLVVESENPGNDTPRALRAILGGRDKPDKLDEVGGKDEFSKKHMRYLTKVARLRAARELESRHSNYTHDPEAGLTLEAVQAYLQQKQQQCTVNPPPFAAIQEVKEEEKEDDADGKVAEAELVARHNQTREFH